MNSDYSSSDSESDNEKNNKKKSNFVINNNFTFDLSSSNNDNTDNNNDASNSNNEVSKETTSWNFKSIIDESKRNKTNHTTSVTEKIKKLKENKVRRAKLYGEEIIMEEIVPKDEEEVISKKKKQESDSEEEDAEDEAQEDIKSKSKSKEKESKAPSITSRPKRIPFLSLNLSKPLLRACAELNFETATPIQAACIPIALTGKDIVANAVTGSGKTAAFILPVLERLIYRPRKVALTRVLILVPTRELAAQCSSMAENLARHTDITQCLIVGGLAMAPQEVALRTRPDICIATPGRLIDHLRNSQTVHLEDIEVLVLDEADRLLELGFADELKEIIKQCPRGRQTMLFSATMTEKINDLVNLSLHNPASVKVDALYSLADHLKQEFIRIHPNQEQHREAIVVALCQRSFHNKTIVFFRSKQHCHRMMIIFGLLNLSAAELHGNLTQTQRLEALDSFREEKVSFLLCTDLAARGLDIAGVEVVINYSFPPELSQYIHRVGRTARAGKEGRSVTLVSSNQKTLLKEVVKRAPASVQTRVLPDAVLLSTSQALSNLAADIEEIVHTEKIEKDLRVAEMQVNKANNVIIHEDDIMSRPKKTWFQNEQERQAAKLLGATPMIDETKKVKPAKEKEEKEEELSAFKKAKLKDPYLGMARKQKRRRMMMDQEIKDQAETTLEEKLGHSNFRVKKQDLEAAKETMKKRNFGTKLVAKAIKKAGGPNTKVVGSKGFAQPKKGEFKGDDEIEPAAKKRKTVKKFSDESYDADSFSNRYKDTGADKPKLKSSDKPFRTKGRKAFKSKSRYQRR